MSFSLGQLLSYGNLTGTAGTDLIYFSGVHSITGSVRTGWVSGVHPKLINPLVTIGTNAYPFDTAGFSAVPLDGPFELHYSFQVVAPRSYADDDAFYYVRSVWQKAWDFIMGTYTLDSVPGCTGQRGWLVMQDERASSSTLYKAKARCQVPGEFDLVKGEPSTLEFTLVFWLLSAFQSY